jgi:hypothetical protein
MSLFSGYVTLSRLMAFLNPNLLGYKVGRVESVLCMSLNYFSLRFRSIEELLVT